MKSNPDPDGPTLYKIRAFELIPELTVKNHEKDAMFSFFSKMIPAGFPMLMMGEEILAPCQTVASLGFDPSKPSGNADDLAPVLLVQLNIVRGGIVLCKDMQHNTCDMMGQAAVIG